MRQLFAVLLLLGIAFTSTACIVEPGHERGCWGWHCR
jgi:hypothetical protein